MTDPINKEIKMNNAEDSYNFNGEYDWPSDFAISEAFKQRAVWLAKGAELHKEFEFQIRVARAIDKSKDFRFESADRERLRELEAMIQAVWDFIDRNTYLGESKNATATQILCDELVEKLAEDIANAVPDDIQDKRMAENAQYVVSITPGWKPLS